MFKVDCLMCRTFLSNQYTNQYTADCPGQGKKDVPLNVVLGYSVEVYSSEFLKSGCLSSPMSFTLFSFLMVMNLTANTIPA